LKIESQLQEDHQVKLIVEIDPEMLEQAKQRAARQISRRTKIPGFRPGKAPYQVIQRHVGDEVLLEEGLELLISDLYPKVIEESGFHPYGPGRFDKLASVDPVTLEFTVPLMAEVELGDYRSIRFPYELPEVSEFQVEEVLQNLRQRQSVEEPVDRSIQEGDRVNIRLSGRRLDSESGSEGVLIRERPYSLIVAVAGEDTAEEWPYNGFSRDLIGMKPGDQKQLTHTFTDETEFVNLRGVEAEFEAQVEEVKSRTLPELDDKFAQSVGEYENIDALRADIRKSLETDARDVYNSEYDDQVVGAIVEQSKLKYSPQMLDDEIDEVIEQLERRLKSQNLDIETYLKTRQMDQAALHEEVRPVAESRLKRSLVLIEIAEIEDIQVEKEELQSETERTLDAMTRFMSESELKKLSSKDLLPSLVGNIMAEMRITRTLERLRSIAKGEVESEETESLDEQPEMEVKMPSEPAVKD
jgi:trigger factor